jgi:branched-chain amino acid transport system substrate-binding protein
MILIQAIKAALATGVKTPANSGDAAQAKVFRQAVINAIQQINYNGVTGHYTFDQNGDITNRILYIYTIADDPNQGNGWKFVSQLSV